MQPGFRGATTLTFNLVEGFHLVQLPDSSVDAPFPHRATPAAVSFVEVVAFASARWLHPVVNAATSSTHKPSRS